MTVKKFLIYIVIALFLVCPTTVSAVDFDLCRDETLNAFKIVGTGITIIKIVIPLLLIILGSVDFGKAVIANDDKAIQSSASALLRRTVAGVIIFFIPTVINAVFSLVNTESLENDDFKKCTECLLDTSKCN